MQYQYHKDHSKNCSIILLGKSGAGKSTYSNLLCQKNMKVIINPTDNHKVVFDCDEKDSFSIGHFWESETKISSCKQVKDKQYSIIDTPGFSDTQSIKQIFEDALKKFNPLNLDKKFKIILVFEMSQFYNDRANSLSILLKQIDEYFQGNLQIRDSILLVFTKVENEQRPQDIYQKLLIKFKKEKQQIIDLVQYLIENERICLFQNPKKDYLNKTYKTKQYREFIFQKLESLQEYVIQCLNITLDDSLINIINQQQQFQIVEQNVLQIQGQIVCLSYVQKIIQEQLLRKQSIKTVRVHVTHSLYGDSHINAPSIQIILMSPKFILFQDTFIILRGDDGLDQPAQILQESQSPGTHGINGVPGNPGSNGGDLLLAVNFIRDSQPFSGGNGGQGQNGQDGTDGKDGISVVKSDCDERKVECLNKIERLGFFQQDGLGKIEQSIKFICTLNEQSQETYVSNYIQPISGGDGGAGGKGGKGGISGRIVLKNTKGNDLYLRERINSKLQNTGSSGLNGKPGKPGKSGSKEEVSQNVYSYSRIFLSVRYISNFSNLSNIIAKGAILGLTAKLFSSAITAFLIQGTLNIASQYIFKSRWKSEAKKIFIGKSENGNQITSLNINNQIQPSCLPELQIDKELLFFENYLKE